MKHFFVAALAFGLFSAQSAFSQAPFPSSPDASMTPGELCQGGKTRRYPEKILYCSRSVGSNLKRQIIAEYDRKLGYRIGEMKREEFKIDHYIPLCMGGSNSPKNLWPQHESVYRYTDEIEHTACGAMSAGKLKQADAVRLIKKAKADPQKAFQILDYVEKL